MIIIEVFLSRGWIISFHPSLSPSGSVWYEKKKWEKRKLRKSMNKFQIYSLKESGRKIIKEEDPYPFL
jgi:hypothetical protein